MVKQFLTSLYFIVVAAVTIFTLMFGTVDLLSTGLKTHVFKAADVPSYLEVCSANTVEWVEEPEIDASIKEAMDDCAARNERMLAQYQQQKAEDAVQSLSMILVSLPLFLLHFRVVYRDWKNEEKTAKKK